MKANLALEGETFFEIKLRSYRTDSIDINGKVKLKDRPQQVCPVLKDTILYLKFHSCKRLFLKLVDIWWDHLEIIDLVPRKLNKNIGKVSANCTNCPRGSMEHRYRPLLGRVLY